MFAAIVSLCLLGQYPPSVPMADLEAVSAVVPAPVAVAAADAAVTAAAAADADLAIINAARARIGAPPYHRDARLDQAAQVHADDLDAGRANPHDDLIGRIASSGWPVRNLHDPHISFGNYSEGVFGRWDVASAVAFLVSERGGRDTHGGDFRDPKFDAIGIGHGPRGQLVFDYGATGAGPPRATATVTLIKGSERPVAPLVKPDEPAVVEAGTPVEPTPTPAPTATSTPTPTAVWYRCVDAWQRSGWAIADVLDGGQVPRLGSFVPDAGPATVEAAPVYQAPAMYSYLYQAGGSCANGSCALPSAVRRRGLFGRW